MSNIHRVTIAIPVYKTSQPSLERAIKSAISQDFENIEIIIVNDSGCDDDDRNLLNPESYDFIKKSCANDSRIIYIEHKKNRGILEARRTAVQQASGEYITFLDSDDEFSSEKSISLLYQKAILTKADIIQGAAEIAGDLSSVPKARYESLRNLLSNINTSTIDNEFENDTNSQHFSDIELSSSTFLTDKVITTDGFNFFVWGKLYSTSLTEKVFSEIPDVYSIMLEDLLFTFLATQFATRYTGISDTIYKYYLGTGITSSNESLSLYRWEHLCTASSSFTIILYWMQEHPQTKSVTEKIYSHAFTAIRNTLLLLEKYILPEDKNAAYDLLLEYWGETLIQKVKKQMEIQDNL